MAINMKIVPILPVYCYFTQKGEVFIVGA